MARCTQCTMHESIRLSFIVSRRTNSKESAMVLEMLFRGNGVSKWRKRF
jgi:hypothetical protein